MLALTVAGSVVALPGRANPMSWKACMHCIWDILQAGSCTEHLGRVVSLSAVQSEEYTVVSSVRLVPLHREDNRLSHCVEDSRSKHGRS